MNHTLYSIYSFLHLKYHINSMLPTNVIKYHLLLLHVIRWQSELCGLDLFKLLVDTNLKLKLPQTAGHRLILQ